MTDEQRSDAKEIREVATEGRPIGAPGASARLERRRRTDLAILAAGAAVALALPAWASRHLDARIDGELEPALSDALDVPVLIEHVEAGAIGELSLTGVHIGNIVAADRVEASVSLQRLLAGELDADEVRIHRPRVWARIDPDGRSNMARLIERAALRRQIRAQAERADGSAASTAPASAGSRSQQLLGSPQRRIVVTGGDLIVDLGSRGDVRIRGLSLYPQRGGLRALAVETWFSTQYGPWNVRGRVGRGAADVGLPGGGLNRLLAVDGEVVVEVAEGGPSLTLGQVALSSNISGQGFVVSGQTSDRGAPAELVVYGTYGGVDQPGVLSMRFDGDDLPLGILKPLVPASVDLGHARGRGYLAMEIMGIPGSGPQLPPGHSARNEPRESASKEPRLSLELDAAVSGAVIGHPHLADAPVDVSMHSRMHATVHHLGTSQRVDVHELELTAGALTLALAGHLTHSSQQQRGWLPDAGALTVTMPETPCASALGSLPMPLRDHLTGLDLAGTVAGTVELSFDRREQDDTQLAIDLDISRCRVLREAPGADPTRLLASFDYRLPDGNGIRLGPDEPGYVPLAEMGRHLPLAFVAAEDARFYRHHGFDVHQIERSLAIDLHERALIRGGSTISQQLVKNVFLSHQRTVARKLQEAVLTWRLERHLSKDQILERYLNIIELGPDIIGVGAAARHWFDTTPATLSVREIAFLAAMTPAPRTLSKRIALAGGVDADIERRVDVILRAMRRGGVITENDYRRARSQTLTVRRDAVTEAGSQPPP